MNGVSELAVANSEKIVLFVLDGLGGLPRVPGGLTELETAKTPRFDECAARGECGLQSPLGHGIAPGSAPGHLALFGYNPFDYGIGRGVVAAMGIGFPMRAGDVAARVNFATKAEDGTITDRRAGRIPTERCAELCEKLKGVRVDGVEVFVRPVKDYRAVLILRGQGLSDAVADTDPQKTGLEPLDPRPTTDAGKYTAKILTDFIAQANGILEGGKPANTVLTRGCAELPHIPSMADLYKLSPIALAVYPDYKGVSRLVGMKVIEGIADLDAQGRALEENWDDCDFFYIHHKYTDSMGEDGDFDGKVREIEKADAFVDRILAQRPDVLIVTGDHSTPAVAKAHTCHPVPFLICGEQVRPDGVTEFGERACLRGSWPYMPGTMLLRLALSYSGKLVKYGA